MHVSGCPFQSPANPSNDQLLACRFPRSSMALLTGFPDCGGGGFVQSGRSLPANARSNSQTLIALERLVVLASSIRATRALRLIASSSAARFNAAQNTGSRLMLVAWPNRFTDRLISPLPATRRAQYICWPPLIDSVEPVMNPASSAQRKATPRAISSAWPSLPTGTRATILVSTSCGTAATISVSI